MQGRCREGASDRRMARTKPGAPDIGTSASEMIGSAGTIAGDQSESLPNLASSSL